MSIQSSIVGTSTVAGGDRKGTSELNDDLPTGWYFPELGDSQALNAQDDREREFLVVLKAKTVSQLIAESQRASPSDDVK